MTRTGPTPLEIKSRLRIIILKKCSQSVKKKTNKNTIMLGNPQKPIPPDHG